MKIIGLTGGIASGKTTISNYLSTLDIKVIDADVVSNKILFQNQDEIVRIFDTSILDKGTLNKQIIQEIIFQDKIKKQQLEKFLHPKIHQKIKQIVSTISDKCVVIEVPLLFEVGWQNYFDEIWLVKSKYQESRLLSRDKINKSLANTIIKSQQVSKYPADIVINNNNDIAHLKQLVLSLIKQCK